LLVVLGREFGYRPHEVAALPIRMIRVLVAGLQRARDADVDDGAVATREAGRAVPMSADEFRRLGAGMHG